MTEIKVSIDTMLNMSKAAQKVYAFALKEADKEGFVYIRPAELHKDMGYVTQRTLYVGIKELIQAEIIEKQAVPFKYKIKTI